MPEDRARLEAALEQLQAELHALREIDPQVRERLEQTVEEIHAELAAADAAQSTPLKARPESSDSFGDRLTEAARHFEESHPNLAGMVGSVIDALARMGI